jgi:hypothetical protein
MLFRTASLRLAHEETAAFAVEVKDRILDCLCN